MLVITIFIPNLSFGQMGSRRGGSLDVKGKDTSLLHLFPQSLTPIIQLSPIRPSSSFHPSLLFLNTFEHIHASKVHPANITPV